MDIQQLMDALNQQRQQMVGSQINLETMYPEWERANTRSRQGLISGLIESAWDSRKRKQLEPEYRGALSAAMDAEAGYNDLAAQLEALQAAQQAEAEQQRKIELERVKADQGIRRDAAKPRKPETPPSLTFAEIPDAQGGTRKVMLDPRTGRVAQDYGSVPQQPTAQQVKMQEKQEAEDTATNQLLTTFDMIAREMEKPEFADAVGPFDTNPLNRAWDKVTQNEEYRTRRNLDRLVGREVLKIGGEALKGSQTIEEWRRIEATFPEASDGEDVWRDWFTDALNVVKAGRPELAEKLDEMIKRVQTPQAQTQTGRPRTRRVGRFVIEEG